MELQSFCIWTCCGVCGLLHIFSVAGFDPSMFHVKDKDLSSYSQIHEQEVLDGCLTPHRSVTRILKNPALDFLPAVVCPFQCHH